MWRNPGAGIRWACWGVAEWVACTLWWWGRAALLLLATGFSGEGSLMVPISRPYKRVLEICTPNVLDPESLGPGMGVGCCPSIVAVVCFAGLCQVCVSVHWTRECYTLVVSDQWLLLQFLVFNGHQYNLCSFPV